MRELESVSLPRGLPGASRERSRNQPFLDLFVRGCVSIRCATTAIFITTLQQQQQQQQKPSSSSAGGAEEGSMMMMNSCMELLLHAVVIDGIKLKFHGITTLAVYKFIPAV